MRICLNDQIHGEIWIELFELLAQPKVAASIEAKRFDFIAIARTNTNRGLPVPSERAGAGSGVTDTQASNFAFA